MSRRDAATLLYALLILVFPVVELLSFIPGIFILTHFEFLHPSSFLAAPLVGTLFIPVLTCEIIKQDLAGAQQPTSAGGQGI